MINQNTIAEQGPITNSQQTPSSPFSPQNFCKIFGGLALSSIPIYLGVLTNCVMTSNVDPAKSQCLTDKMPIGFALGWSALGTVILVKEATRRLYPVQNNMTSTYFEDLREVGLGHSDLNARILVGGGNSPNSSIHQEQESGPQVRAVIGVEAENPQNNLNTDGTHQPSAGALQVQSSQAQSSGVFV